jgi:4-methylaminobutanoate oxidase (formaldehyde-forming)
VVVAAGAAADEVGNDAIPMRRAGSVHIGPAPVHAARISYAGELGWELTTPVDWAVAVWDRLRAAGAEPIGYRALEALRMEKGYRYYGTDLTMLDTPFDAGLGPFVRLEKGGFIGQDALVAAHAAGSERRLSTLVIGGPDYEPIYGGEAVRLGGAVVGRLRSVAYGPTVERTIGYAYLPVTAEEGTELEIDVFDRRVGAVIGPDVLVDARGERMRA